MSTSRLTKPQNGSLAVAGGRDLAPTINHLLSLPFVLKVATKDFHPTDHISFAPNHEPPNNKPYESLAIMINPFDPAETKQTRLWPVHCVQDTPGADIIPEIDTSRFDAIVRKGQDRRVEMYSGFADAFGGKLGASMDLAALLREKRVSHVYVVGLAGDYCVKATAMDAQKEGFKTCVIEEGVKSVDPSEKGWGEVKREIEEGGVSVVRVDGVAVNKVRRIV